MTKPLQRAFEEVSKLPESEQDALGRILLDELASERRWEDLLVEHRAGRTEKLDPSKL